MRIERALADIYTLGPGNRLGIWVNGCHRNCPGCVSKRLQKIDNEVDFVIEEYFKDYNFGRFDGVTISGGEPFDQIDELDHLVKFLKEMGINDILVYTGYLLNDLIMMNNPIVISILSNISVLIDGPYIESLNDDTNNIKGSSNQEIYYLKKEYKEIYQKYIHKERMMQEMQYGNTLIGVGIPTKEYIRKF